MLRPAIAVVVASLVSAFSFGQALAQARVPDATDPPAMLSPENLAKKRP